MYHLLTACQKSPLGPFPYQTLYANRYTLRATSPARPPARMFWVRLWRVRRGFFGPVLFFFFSLSLFIFFGFVFGESGENFSVKFNSFLLQKIDEFAVGESILTDSGVDADIPERAEIGFFVLAVCKRVLAGMHIRFPCGTLFFGTCKTIALCFP